MHSFIPRPLRPAGLLLPVMACTANRPVPVSPEPPALSTHLHTEHPRDIEITDTARRIVWLHNPELAGDSLTGVVSREDVRLRRGVPIAAIRVITQPRLSTGRTIGLVVGVLGSAGVALLIVATNGAEPVY
jgi:hypothetical protein